MEDKRSVDRVRDLLRELQDLLAKPDPAVTRTGLGAELTAWRQEMDRVWPGALPALTPAEREDLARRVREVQLHLEGCLRQQEKAKRTLLVRLLACQAARNTLGTYRRPAARGGFSRTV